MHNFSTFKITMPILANQMDISEHKLKNPMINFNF